MIANLASRVVKKLIDSSAIEDTEQELYIYGFFVLLSQILFFTVTVILGILLGIVLESAVFYVAFQFIRRYAGGIHASSELKCELATATSIFLCLLCVKFCEMYNAQAVILALTGLASFCILFLCPLDTPEKPLTEKEKKYFRKISWAILLIIILVIGVGYSFKIKFLMYPCCMSLILESILLAAGKVKQRAEKCV